MLKKGLPYNLVIVFVETLTFLPYLNILDIKFSDISYLLVEQAVCGISGPNAD